MSINWHFNLFYPGKPEKVFWGIQEELERVLAARDEETNRTEEIGVSTSREIDGSWRVGASGDFWTDPDGKGVYQRAVLVKADPPVEKVVEGKADAKEEFSFVL